MENTDFHLLLASQSPRRAQLLTQMGLSFEVLKAKDVHSAAELEALEEPTNQEEAHRYVVRVAELKLRYHLGALQGDPTMVNAGAVNTWVLCADTTVSIDGHILGKPEDAEDAVRMLTRLSGREHQVFTALCLGCVPSLGQELQIFSALSRSDVRFAPLSVNQIENYIATGEAYGKAGAYAIQGRAGMFAEHIAGSYTGIMGLPLFETASLLRLAGWQG